jgi:23S rRNA pseudouridine2605 synthase
VKLGKQYRTIIISAIFTDFCSFVKNKDTMAKVFKRGDKKDFKKKKSFGSKTGNDFKERKEFPYKKSGGESFSSNESKSDKPYNSENKSFKSKRNYADKAEEKSALERYKAGAFRPDESADKSENPKDKTFRSKKSPSGKDKPAFERFKDESRPSDFGTPKSRKTGGFKEGGSFPKKRTFSKPTEEGGEKPAYFDKDKKSFDKKPFSKKSTFVRKKEMVNPYDLDESDFKHDTSSEDRPSFKKPKSSGGKKSFSESSKSDDGTIRLNKYIANAGICSRREADTLISSGVVQVNGKNITEMGYKVKPTDIVKYGGQTLKKERLVYLILNKPKDYITTVDDPEERRTVLELIHGACKERIYPVGRLDRATTGLLMFTNDGELTKKLTHPRYGVRKVYHVGLDKALKRADLDKIAGGVELEDGPITVDDISYVGDGADKEEVGVELHSGRNRIVRRLFESVGYNVRKLDRVVFGPLTKKDLPRGRWRFLTEAEVGMLKMLSSKEGAH